MIVNYDKEKSKLTWSNFFKKQIPEIDQETTMFFKKVNDIQKAHPDIPIDFDKIIENGNIANKTLVDYINTTDKSQISLDGYKKHLESVGKTTSTFSKAISKVGSVAKGALAFAGNVALMWTISKGIELAAKVWDNYSHSQEKAIERGDSALSNMKSNQKSTVQNTSYECTLQSAFTLERM